MDTPFPDYSLLDETPMARVMFYPRDEWEPAPEGAADVVIPVDEGASLAARFYRHDPAAPTILFFHGNGEVAMEYDAIAHFYRQAGVNLIVVDYRGYGASSGSPTFGTMLSDAHTVLRAVRLGLAGQGYTGKLFTMGRSLGSHSAAEIAAHYPDELAGMISESGASGIGRMITTLAQMGYGEESAELARRHEEKIKSIRIPVLVLHGEKDLLVPLETAQTFYEKLETPEKQIVIIPEAGHNDIMMTGLKQYFTALQEFIQAHS